jgi:hypothetical protein
MIVQIKLCAVAMHGMISSNVTIHELLLIQELICDSFYIAMYDSKLEQIGEEIFRLSLILGPLAVVQNGRCQLAYCPLLPPQMGSHLGNLQRVIHTSFKQQCR